MAPIAEQLIGFLPGDDMMVVECLDNSRFAGRLESHNVAARPRSPLLRSGQAERWNIAKSVPFRPQSLSRSERAVLSPRRRLQKTRKRLGSVFQSAFRT